MKLYMKLVHWSNLNAVAKAPTNIRKMVPGPRIVPTIITICIPPNSHSLVIERIVCSYIPTAYPKVSV
jgi:hypothetical protein